MVSAAKTDEPTLFPNTPGLRMGQVLAGRYAISRVIGAGGMATIVEATHLELGSRVAIKVLHTIHASSEAVDRFLREARAIFPLRSENVCRVLDLGRVPDGSPFIVMEFLEGTDFANGFRGVQVAPARAASLVAQACKGLAEAHALGIVHRDIKPANLFLTKSGGGAELVKVLDFGISKLRREGDESLTAEGQVLGTPRYMAPEQFGGATEADARADVWALGLVLFKLIAGRLPYTAVTLADIYAELMNRAPEDIRHAVPGIDPGLAAIIMRCLERDASKRFLSARDLGAALEPFTRGRNEEVLVAAPAPQEAPPTLADPVPAKRRVPWVPLLAGVALALLATTAYFATRPQPAPIVETPAPPVPPPPVSTTSTTTTAPITSTQPVQSSSAPAPVISSTRRTTSRGPKKPDCSTPFYTNSRGDKVFRTECLP